MSTDSQRAANKRYKNSDKYPCQTVAISGKKSIIAAIEEYIDILNKNSDDLDVKVTKSNYFLYAGIYCMQNDIDPLIDVDKSSLKKSCK